MGEIKKPDPPEILEKKLRDLGLPSDHEVKHGLPSDHEVKHGLPSDHEVEKVPIELTPSLVTNDEEAQLNAEVETILSRYADLDPQIQKQIVADLKKLQAQRCSFQEILERLDLLAEYGYELMALTSNDSDEKYKPAKPKSEVDVDMEYRVDKLIKKLEKRIEKDKKKLDPKDTVH